MSSPFLASCMSHTSCFYDELMSRKCSASTRKEALLCEFFSAESDRHRISEYNSSKARNRETVRTREASLVRIREARGRCHRILLYLKENVKYANTESD